MAYGTPSVKPKRSMRRIEAKGAKLTTPIQQGKSGVEGADEDAQPNFGRLPASGNFQANAGGSGNEGGSKATGAMKGEGGKSPSSSHSQPSKGPSHAAVAEPEKPGSHGGAGTGSIDTLTKLIFHPAGGFDKPSAGAKRPKGAHGYKDSGPSSGRKVTGVSH